MIQVRALVLKLATVTVAATIGICVAGGSRGAAAAGKRAAGRDRPNVVLISIDTLRPDHLGTYGYRRATSPAIDELAADGAVFEDATSSTSWTLPAHAALFTGLPDSVHGCRLGSNILAAERITVAERLKEAGYVTAGFWSGPLLEPEFGLGQGFDDYVSCVGYHVSRHGEAWEEADASSHSDVTGPRILERVGEWLRRAPRRKPLFVFVHLWDVHYDYIPPPPYDTLYDPDYQGPVDGRDLGTNERLQRVGLPDPDARHLVALYDGEIAWTDHNLSKLLVDLRHAGVLRKALVIVLSDHGEEFFEHGRFGHKRQLYEESIRIPLIVRFPGVVPRGTRIAEPVRIVDVAPTILEAAGAEPLPGILGRSLLPLIRGEAGAGDRLVISELAFNQDRAFMTVRRGRMKAAYSVHHQQPVGLWDLADDPGERVNLLRRGPQMRSVAQELLQEGQRRLAELAAGDTVDSAQSHQISPELEEQLRALGYLSSPDGD